MTSSSVALAAAADIPSLDRLLNDAAFAPMLVQYGRSQVVATLRGLLEALRQCVRRGELQVETLTAESLAAEVQQRLVRGTRPRLRPVFNLTGTVLHTNFGRAPLPRGVLERVLRAAGDAVNLEYDLDSGARGDRDDVVEPLLQELTGAEAATVVNNNAAAVLLILNTLAHKREVVVSRGELVEIGGAFRIPDVMRSAGARLIEVGTTNRTHLSDYADAITARSTLLMKVHASNYTISGYTAAVDLKDLSALGRQHGIPVAVDLGSGSLVDLTRWGLPREPVVRDAIAAGADLVAFSGDKLLGGPQAGIVVGRADLIQRLKKNPLKRALRVGKLTLAALEGVLALYRTPEDLAVELTTLQLLTRRPGDIEAQARRLLPVVQAALSGGYFVTVQAMNSQVGSGALPSGQLASFGWHVLSSGAKGSGLNRLDDRLRGLSRPIIGRLAEKALWFDLRCLADADEADFLAQWAALAG